jgi:hypothetical protein
MDEIGQGPDNDRQRRASRSWLTTGAMICLVLVALVVAVRSASGSHPAPAPAASKPAATAARSAPVVAAPAPAAQLVAAPGTVLLTCDSVTFSNEPDWKAGSLRVGSLWLVGGRSLGYVRDGRAASAAGAPSGQAPAAKAVVSVVVQMLVHIDPGARVVMRAAAGTWPAFDFLNSPASIGDFQGLGGGLGYTFAPCPGADPGYGTGFYDVGFAIVPGHMASVEVQASPSARPVWLTFTAPAKAG